MKVLMRLDKEDVLFMLSLIEKNERDPHVRNKKRQTIVKDALQTAIKLDNWNKVVINENT